MKSLRRTGALFLILLAWASVAGAGPSQKAVSPRGTPPVGDPTAVTSEGQRTAEERARWEREFDLDLVSRRYWRPVVRIGQDYSLRAGETVRNVTIVFGRARIEGRVEGDLVVVFGQATLGATAVVEGSFVVIGGTADVRPGAMVRDQVVVVGTSLDLPEGFIFGGEHVVIGTRALGRWMESVVPWVTYGLLWGRPIVASIGWVWSVVGLFLLVYLLINLVAHEPVSATASALASRPFGSFMTGLLVLLLAGPVSALLAVSIIGIAVIPFALAAVVVAGFVGRVGVLRWLGNTVMPTDDPTSRMQGLRAFAIGFVLVTLTYMVPLLGIMAWALFGVLGLGAAVLAFLTAWRREHPKVEKPARVAKNVPTPAPPSEPESFVEYAFTPPPTPPAPASVSPSDLASFPRAMFLDRAAAFVIDFVLVVFVVRLLHPLYFLRGDDVFFPTLLAYFVGFWAWKGSTIGGIVTNLRVVKVAGGELSFLESLVRGLTSILSFGALGIGVLWILRSDLVATDGLPARQAWHDLAAGTYVVKVPKGYPLP